MKCKYVLMNGFLLKDIVNGKYENITFEKLGFNQYLIKSGEKNLAVWVSKKYVRFVKELLWCMSFVPKENKQ